MSKKAVDAGGTHGKNSSKGGGPATAGGIDFQAAVTTIAGIHVIVRSPLNWLDGVVGATPVSVWSETNGPGDDIRIDLNSGEVIEIQAKKGLSRGDRLWVAMMCLARGIAKKVITYGILAVSPTSSATICQDLAQGVRRIGEGRTDGLNDISRELLNRLNNAGLDAGTVCSRIRVHTVHALEDDSVSIDAAIAMLNPVCGAGATAAWDRLYREAVRAQLRRGCWTLESLVRILMAANIEISSHGKSSVANLSKLINWQKHVNENFSIVGYGPALLIDTVWLPLRVTPMIEKPDENIDAHAVLTRYQKRGEPELPRLGEGKLSTFDAEWVGSFQRRSVIIAGPGMGKTTLLTRMARNFAKEGYPVLKVSLRRVAERMIKGASFLEALSILALDEVAVESPLQILNLRDCVILCDGLDEAQSHQELVAQGLVDFTAGRSGAHVVVTTRPVGYVTPLLRNWRHYEILRLTEESGGESLLKLIDSAMTPDDKKNRVPSKLVADAIGKNPAIVKVLAAPQLIAMAAALILGGGDLGKSKIDLYHNLFKLISKGKPLRPGISNRPLLANRMLDLLCWQIIATPTASVESVIERCAVMLRVEESISTLTAEDYIHEGLQHWEALGILETLHHGVNDLLVAGHQTFAEYAAARRLNAILADLDEDEIETMMGSPAWDEVFYFAACMGKGGSIVETMLRLPDPHSKFLKRAMAIILDADETVQQTTRKKVIGRAIDTLGSQTDEEVSSIGILLADICARLPATITEFDFFEHKRSVTKIEWIAKNCLLHSNSMALLEEIVGDVQSGMLESESLSSQFKIKFHLILLKRIIELRPRPFVEKYLADLSQDGTISVELMFEVGGYAQSHGFELPNWGISRQGFQQFITPPDQYRAAEEVMLVNLLEVILGKPTSAVDRPVKNSSLLHWRAFIEATQMLRSPPHEKLAWCQPFDQDAFAELINVLIDLSGVDRLQLREDAQQIFFMDREDPYAHIPAISLDIAMDWDRIPLLEIDRAKLEKALFHPVPWVAEAAADVLSHLPAPSTEHQRNLLHHASGHAYFALARLLSIYDKDNFLHLLVDQLEHTDNAGVEDLYEVLLGYRIEWSERLGKIISRSLKSSRRLLVLSAVRLTASYPPATVASLVPELRRAYFRHLNYELGHAPVTGFALDSPRGVLFKLLVEANGFSSEEREICSRMEKGISVRDTSIAYRRAQEMLRH